MKTVAAKQALSTVWDYLRRRWPRWWEAQTRARFSEPVRTRDEDARRLAENRRRFWAEFDEGRRQAEESRPDAGPTIPRDP